MQATRYNGHIFSILSCLIILLAACSTNTTPSHSHTSANTGITTPINRGITPISRAATTVTMPTTQTNCPASGTARAMITAPLALGNHQNIIYTHNLGTYDSPGQSKILRYDAQTGLTVELLSVANAQIFEAQVSTDGQWVLFITTTGSADRQSKLQMLRMDGQGLQTLYCTPEFGIRHMLWSANQRLLAFYNVVNQQGTVYLLDISSGRIQIELTTPPQVGLVLRTWLDASHLYISNTPLDTLFEYIYLLDIRKGAHQHLRDLQTIFFDQYGDFDSSYDGSQLLMSHGGCPQGFCTGPSSITVQTIPRGRQRTIYSSKVYDVIAVRVIDQTSILFMIGNTYDSNGVDDPSHNGLWKINIDGSGLTHLLPITAKQYSLLNYWTQDVWSNVSRDASMYVLQVNGFHGFTETDALYVGSLHENVAMAKAFVSTTDGSLLTMAGWTVM